MRSYQITFGFGVGEDKDGTILNDEDANEQAIRKICKRAAELFGGYSIFDCNGGWVNPAGRLVEEPSKALVVHCEGIWTGEETIPAKGVQIRELASLIKSELNQEAIALTQVRCDFEIV